MNNIIAITLSTISMRHCYYRLILRLQNSRYHIIATIETKEYLNSHSQIPVQLCLYQTESIDEI